MVGMIFGAFRGAGIRTAPGLMATRGYSTGFMGAVSRFFGFSGPTVRGQQGPRVVVVSKKEMEELCDENWNRMIRESAEKCKKQVAKQPKAEVKQ